MAYLAENKLSFNLIQDRSDLKGFLSTDICMHHSVLCLDNSIAKGFHCILIQNGLWIIFSVYRQLTNIDAYLNSPAVFAQRRRSL